VFAAVRDEPGNVSVKTIGQERKSAGFWGNRRSTWPQLRRQLDRIAVGTFTGPAGTFRQRTEITPAQAAILEQPGIDPPPRIYQLTPAATP
jgi:hypothetical protein